MAPNYNNPEKLFGSREVRSSNMRAFTKWNGVMERLDNAGLQNWGTDLTKFQALPTQAKIRAVNNYVNKIRYIEDRNNWSQSDYWATPAEFFARGGDCEDFAIAKFAALKKLGVPESQMRLAIVQDKIKNIPHAILIVYTEDGAVMLDNQIKSVERVSSVSRYKPIYSINRDAWWRHIGES
jgi:predicted transglutaminase-like cysteine proteinase